MDHPLHISTHIYHRYKATLLRLGCVAVWMATLLWAGSARAAHPIVRNFSRSEYGAGAQNWGIAQGADGAMVFANTLGLLTFDSRSWQVYPVDNNSAIRSVLIDDRKSRIYVGATNDFGYFAPDSLVGTLRYHSLRPTISTPDTDFSEIWAIHDAGIPDAEMLWFQGDFKLFCYNGEKTSCIPTGKKITASALSGGELYVAFIDGTLARVQGRQLTPLPALDDLKDVRICSLLPLDKAGNLLIVTNFYGVYIYNGSTVEPYPLDIDPFLKTNQTFCAARGDGKLVFGTVADGLVIKDMATGENSYVNLASGLQNNTVLSVKFDNFNNLWLGLDNGIDFVLASSPITSLLAGSDFIGAGYASLCYADRMFLGTNQGLFSSPATSGRSAGLKRYEPELKGQVWSIDTIGRTMFVSSDAGLYYRNGVSGPFVKIPDVPGTWSVIPLRKRPGAALASTYDSFYLLTDAAGTGEWTTSGVPISGYSDVGGRPVEDDKGDIWITHWIKGVYRLTPAADYSAFNRVRLYDTTRGLPSDANNLVFQLASGEVVFSSEAGFYKIDARADSMVPYASLNQVFPSSRSTHLYPSPDGRLWSVAPSGIAVATFGADGSCTIDSTTYRPVADVIIPGFENLHFVDGNHLIISSQEGFCDIDLSKGRSEAADSLRSNPVVVTRVVANGDSVIYSNGVVGFPRRDNADALEVPYDLNSLCIEYVLAEYRSAEALTYSVKLENYDEQWSQFGPSTSKEYTHLAEGSYTFVVRAFNAYTGLTTECRFPIVVKAPWYRSIVAKIIYFLMVMGLLYFSIMLFRRYSTRAARRMEAQKEREMEAMKRRAREETLKKDFEIAQLKSQQLEHDIKNKSGELSNITMNVIRKNEILLDIASRLTKIQETTLSASESEDAAKLDKQLDKIKLLIRENISHDDDWRNFTRNFDIVYENYMKRLTERYPNLSDTDQRICAYIKMGLSSKEIAPLINISYRSVEMTRYRLRKKMGLSRDTNLAEYLRNF